MCATGRLSDHSDTRPQASLWDWQADPGRSPRDTRRVWARLRPQTPAFRNPTARLLAEWADAVLHDDCWEAWSAGHRDVDNVLSGGPDR